MTHEQWGNWGDEAINLCIQQELVNREIFLEMNEQFIKELPDGVFHYNEAVKKLEQDKLNFHDRTVKAPPNPTV